MTARDPHEPTDAEVEAAAKASYEQDFGRGAFKQASPGVRSIRRMSMRAALRAAAKVRSDG